MPLRPWAIALGWAALLVPFVLEAVAIVRANRWWLIHLPDDVYYYLEVGRRMSHGQGSTFDGIHATNGYHPLWQWMLVPLSWLFPGESAYVKAVLLLALTLTLVAVVLVVRVVWRLVGPGPALVGAILAVHGRSALAAWVNGMEGAVVVLALALVLTVLVRWAERPEARRAALVGAVCALAILARLDLVAVIWIVPLAMAVRTRSWRPAAAWLGGAAVLGAPFAVWFVTRYHHLLTVSATVKQHDLDATLDRQFGGRLSSGFARYWVDLARDYWRTVSSPASESLAGPETAVARLVTLAIAALGALGLVVGYRDRYRAEVVHGGGRDRAGTDRSGSDRGRPASPEGFGLWVLAVVVMAKAVFDLTSAPLWAQAWYSAPQHLALPFATGAFAWLGARWLVAHRRPVGIAATAVLVVACLPLNARRASVSATAAVSTGNWQDQIELAADWVRQDGPPGRYGARDAGLLGYRLDGLRDVVNLDGLVNNYEYADYLARGPSILDAARSQGIDHFVGRVLDEDLAGQFGCADVQWTSPDAIAYGDGLSGDVTTAHLYVLDLTPCR